MNISFRLAREYISGGYNDFGGYFGGCSSGRRGRERRLRRVSRRTNKRCCEFSLKSWMGGCREKKFFVQGPTGDDKVGG